eukprot:839591-Rhodomonas_salina.3
MPSPVLPSPSSLRPSMPLHHLQYQLHASCYAVCGTNGAYHATQSPDPDPGTRDRCPSPPLPDPGQFGAIAKSSISSRNVSRPSPKPSPDGPKPLRDSPMIAGVEVRNGRYRVV